MKIVLVLLGLATAAIGLFAPIAIVEAALSGALLITGSVTFTGGCVMFGLDSLDRSVTAGLQQSEKIRQLLVEIRDLQAKPYTPPILPAAPPPLFDPEKAVEAMRAAQALTHPKT